ncbi:MAG: DUF6445 family protein [Alteraurantiacibacter sp.]
MTHFPLADSLDARMVPVGTAGEHVMVVDGVMRDWRALRDTAAGMEYRDVGTKGGFPGLRAPLPGSYARALLRRLDPHIHEHFFAGRAVKLTRFVCNFSLVTYPPDRLRTAQKLPHVDVADGNRIALLHYLCPNHFGGTAFYRQNATGLEKVDPEDKLRWGDASQAEQKRLDPARGYADASLPGYTQLANVAAKPDRLVAYRSNLLHSGVIDAPELLSPDPLRGRLTANFFLDYAPKPH